jgi:tetratricopeptide (TPR) repeat protein
MKDMVVGMMEEMKALTIAHSAGQPSELPPAFGANEPKDGLHPVDRMLAMIHGLYIQGTTLLQHYFSSGDKRALNEAVQALGGAFNMSSPKHPELPTYMLALGRALAVMFEADSGNKDRDVRIIDDAIMFLTRCVEMTKEDEDRSDRQDMLNRLGEAYTARFEHSKNPNDLSSAIQTIQRAIDATAPVHGELFLMFFSLGTVHLMRYNELGETDGLGEAAIALKKAIDSAPVSTPRLPLMLVMRAKALEERFERMEDIRDIDEAIVCARRAFELSTQGRGSDLKGVDYRHYLIQVLGHRWQHTNQDADVEEIGTLSQEGLAQMDPTDEEYIRFVMISASWSIAHYRQNRNIKHIDESIALFDIASTGISKDDPAYVTILANSTNARLMRYDHLHDISDLHQLISLLQTAIDAFPQHRQELAEWRERLGSAYRFRYDALQNIDDLHEAASQYRQAAMFTLGTQRQRALCARMWALTADRLGKADESLEAYQLAVELGTLLTGLERSIGQRRVYLEEAHKLGLYIATKAVEKGEVERAVVWLEQGRGLLWRQLHHVRSPVDGLEAHNPDLAKRVREVSRKLEDGDLLSVSPESQPKVGGDMHWTLSMPKDVRRVVWKDNESTTRFALVLEWEAVLREVRQEEGFETFLRPPPIQDTTTYLPRQGFTILLHAHEEGSYAIIIDRDPNKETDVRLRSIPLTDFTFTKGKAMVRDLHTRLNAAGLRGSEERTGDLDDTEDPTRALKAFVRPNAKQTTITSVLKDLWNVVVKPIVEYLELKVSSLPISPLC